MRFRIDRPLANLGAVFLVFVVLGLHAPAPAAAQQFSIEAFAGYYDPENLDDDAEDYGARFGYRPNDNFGFLVGAGAIDLEDQVFGTDVGGLSVDVFLVDFSFQWFPAGRSFYVFAGPGWATVDIKLDLPGNSNNLEASDDTFTVNGGIGFQWNFGESFFVRPQAMLRWYEGDSFDADNIDSYDGLDKEYSLGFGWRF